MNLQKNLISAIAGWKSAALLALVAMVAAVAFSGVLTSTESADAQTGVTNSSNTVLPSDSVPAGSTVTVIVTGTVGERFRFSSDSEGSATFVANGAQNLKCGDYDSTNTAGPGSTNATILNAACDTDGDSGEVGIQVKIDDDSPLGSIWVQNYTRGAQGADPTINNEVEITVVRANPPVAFKALYAPGAAIPSDGTTPTTIRVQLVNAGAQGLQPQPVLVTTTRGVLTSTDIPTGGACTTVSACNLQTQPAGVGPDGTAGTADDVLAGQVLVTLAGNGSTGTAEVSFHHQASGLSHTANVIIHGNAASITAAADQSTIAVGGSTFIVVSILDADGNPTVGKFADVNNSNPLAPAIRGPEVPAGTSATPVTKDINVDRNLPGVANDLPACGDNPNDDTTTADVDESNGGLTAAAGTGNAGKCVIKITAPGDNIDGNAPGPSDDATRGTHTLTIAVTATNGGAVVAQIATVDVEIQVGGAPASIDTSAAPASVDPLSSTSITVTVLDDEGVRVGAVPISVVQVEGSGKADAFPGGDAAMTSDGRATFTYLAPLSSGEAVFLIRAGDPAKGQRIQDTITIAIGDAAMDDDMEMATWNQPLASGTHNLVWNGADGADPSDGAGSGVTAIWQWNGSSWDGYFPSAADVPGGNTLTSLTNGAAYWVIVE